MRKQLSKGQMKPFLLEYMINFGTEWQRLNGRFGDWMKLNKRHTHHLFMQAIRFKHIEYKRVVVHEVELLGEQMTLTQLVVRLSPKGLRRIASRSH